MLAMLAVLGAWRLLHVHGGERCEGSVLQLQLRVTARRSAAGTEVCSGPLPEAQAEAVRALALKRAAPVRVRVAVGHCLAAAPAAPHCRGSP